MRISKFNNFNNLDHINETKLYIFEKPFRVDDLLITNIYKLEDIRKWAKKYKFDKWAIGLFISKDIIIDADDKPFEREKDNMVKTSDISLDTGEIDNETIIEEEPEDIEGLDLKELLSKTNDKIKLRLSSKGTKSKIYFDDSAKSNNGTIIKESLINYNNNEDLSIYLYSWFQ
jgi:hypothetical protein